jgi:hypothetical protein
MPYSVIFLVEVRYRIPFCTSEENTLSGLAILTGDDSAIYGAYSLLTSDELRRAADMETNEALSELADICQPMRNRNAMQRQYNQFYGRNGRLVNAPLLPAVPNQSKPKSADAKETEAPGPPNNALALDLLHLLLHVELTPRIS